MISRLYIITNDAFHLALSLLYLPLGLKEQDYNKWSSSPMTHSHEAQIVKVSKEKKA